MKIGGTFPNKPWCHIRRGGGGPSEDNLVLSAELIM